MTATNDSSSTVTASSEIINQLIDKNPTTRKDDAVAEEEEAFPLLPISSPNTIKACASLPLRSTDIFIASYPKSGTTWMQHIVHTLSTDGNSPLPHISDACPFFEVDRTWEEGNKNQEGEEDSSSSSSLDLAANVCKNHNAIKRRIFNTHLRWEHMPKKQSKEKDGNNNDSTTSNKNDSAKYIYMVRRPDDACVSFYHHLTHRSIEDGGYDKSFDEFVYDYCHAGRMPYGTWSAHVKSWIQKTTTNRDHDHDGDYDGARNILVLKYEDLKTDLRGCVGRVNDHCNFGLSDERLDELLPRFTFEWMRSNESMFEPRSVRWVKRNNRKNEEEEEEEEEETFHFIRKGRIGDGKKMFSPHHLDQLRYMIYKTFGNKEGVPTFVFPLLSGIIESQTI